MASVKYIGLDAHQAITVAAVRDADGKRIVPDLRSVTDRLGRFW